LICVTSKDWSLALDALILWKTIGAVVRSHGSYSAPRGRRDGVILSGVAA
jgi:hypothetical protein